MLIVEPAPMVTCDPILMGATRTEFAPVFELSSIIVLCLFLPSKLAVIVPGPILIFFPRV